MTVKEITDVEFEAEVLNSAETVLVEFGAKWCGPCKKQLPVLEQFAQDENVKVFKVDIDEDPALAKQFSIKNIPAIFAFKDGKVTQSLTGLTNATKLKTLL